jgi:hypothetical protein
VGSRGKRELRQSLVTIKEDGSHVEAEV